MRAARRAYGPAVAASLLDREVWEAAELLGVGPGDDAPPQVRSGQRDLVAERVRAHRLNLPPPEPDPPMYDPQVARLMQMAGGGGL